MPKIVDHAKQKEKIAEAVWRIIRRDGLEGASVRNIAEEAGLPMSSMRHYFSSQAQLFAFSMQMVNIRVEERIRCSLPANSAPTFEGLKYVLLQVLPVDEERRLEMEVWFSFVTKSLSDPQLKELSDQTYEGLLRLMKLVIHTLVNMQLARPGLNAELEAKRLYALVDGLAIHGIMRTDQVTPGEMDAILTHHLRSLCQ